MANTVYANQVLEGLFKDLLNTKLNTRSLMKVDASLAANAGMKKVINVYSYTGEVEQVEKGAANTVRGAITFTPVDYDVLTYQQTFAFYDEEFQADPNVLDMGVKGATQVMVNDMNSKFFAELAKATLTEEYTADAFGYDVVVDAIAKLNVEDETNLYIIMGNDLKAQVRKDADFVASKLSDIIYTGQFGSISGLPVVFSALVPEDTAYVVEKGAITNFVKKDVIVEKDRDIETRENIIVMRQVGLVALTDATKVVKIAPAIVPEG